MTSPDRDVELGTALRQLEVPEHGPEFFSRLLERLEAEAQERLTARPVPGGSLMSCVRSEAGAIPSKACRSRDRPPPSFREAWGQIVTPLVSGLVRHAAHPARRYARHHHPGVSRAECNYAPCSRAQMANVLARPVLFLSTSAWRRRSGIVDGIRAPRRPTVP